MQQLLNPEKLKETKINKWMLLGVFSYVQNLHKGCKEDEAKINAVVTCICGYSNRIRGSNPNKKIGFGRASNRKLDKAEKEGKIKPEEYDKIKRQLGDFYDLFKDKIEELIKKNVDYKEIKTRVDFPTTIGARISLEQFFNLCDIKGANLRREDFLNGN